MAKRRGRRRHRKRQRDRSKRKINRARDFISSLPDVILQHILSFIPTNIAIKTSLLSRRWKHVWCETPCIYFDGFRSTARKFFETLSYYTAPKISTPSIYFDGFRPTAPNLIETLSYYKAPKISSFHLSISPNCTAPQIDNLIQFAVSHNVQKLSVDIFEMKTFSFPDFFYLSSSLKQLSVKLKFADMIPRCAVSWKSLRNLSLSFCNLSDESIANILSGCPKLESLTMHLCGSLECLDLSKSLSLTRLEITCKCWVPGPKEIVAPHIHYMRLKTYDKLCTLVDVSSLTGANLDLDINTTDGRYNRLPLEADFLQIMVLKMLAKCQNVERLTLGGTVLQIVSLAELRGVPFPMLKVQTLIVQTLMFSRSVIPGIARLLQSSLGLKKLIVHIKVHIMYIDTRPDTYFDSYLRSQGLNPDQCWIPKYDVFPTSKEIDAVFGSKDATSKLLASFMELVLSNTKTLETMVVRLGGIYFDDAKWFEEQLQMVQTLSHNTNVSIVLKRSNC